MITLDNYKNLLFNTIMEDYNKHLKAKLTKMLLEANISSKRKTDEEKVYVVSLPEREKFRNCLDKTNDTIKVIELLEINKGYKYSIPFKILNINLNALDNFAININNYEWVNLNQEDIEKPVYINNDDICAIKYFKIIDIIDSETGKRGLIRYPILIVIHKKLNILEFRFDRIIHKKDEVFYLRSIEAFEDNMKNKLDLKIEPYELGRVLAEIVKNYTGDVKEEVCSMGFPGEKGVVVKYGKNNIMPILGDIEELIENNREKFSEAAIEILNNFVFEKKVLSNKHYREIKWLNNPYNGNTKDENKKFLRTRITFNYKGKYQDLIDFHYSNLNDMERMNNVIKFIDKIKRTI